MKTKWTYSIFVVNARVVNVSGKCWSRSCFREVGENNSGWYSPAIVVVFAERGFRLILLKNPSQVVNAVRRAKKQSCQKNRVLCSKEYTLELQLEVSGWRLPECVPIRTTYFIEKQAFSIWSEAATWAHVGFPVDLLSPANDQNRIAYNT